MAEAPPEEQQSAWSGAAVCPGVLVAAFVPFVLLRISPWEG